MKEYLKLKLNYRKPSLSKEQYKEFIRKINLYNLKDAPKPLITFLIVAYNEEKLLFRLLDSIISNKSKLYEILIVDNGLSDNTKERLKSYKLKHIILNKNLGCASGRNVGSLYSDADILFFVDADGVLDNIDTVINKAEYLRNENKLVAIRGKVVEFESNFLASKPKNYDLGNESIPTFLDAEGVTLMKRKDFVSVGGFEDGLPGNEGLILCYRMVELYDYKLDSFIYDPELILFHQFFNGLKHMVTKRERYKALSNLTTTKYPLIKYLTRYYMNYRKGLRNNSINNKISKKITDTYLKLKTNKSFVKVLKEYNSKSDEFTDKYNFKVFIFCSNLGAYLHQLINHVEEQTLNSIKIIVVDICSNENETLKILNQIKERVEVIEINDRSLVTTILKEEIVKMDCEYFCFIKCIEHHDPTYLEKVKNILDNYYSTGIVAPQLANLEKLNIHNYTNNKDSIEKLLLNSDVHWMPCFRKNAFIQNFICDDLTKSLVHNNNWLKTIDNGWDIKLLP